jgi:hypothetical protein
VYPLKLFNVLKLINKKENFRKIKRWQSAPDVHIQGTLYVRFYVLDFHCYAPDVHFTPWMFIFTPWMFIFTHRTFMSILSALVGGSKVEIAVRTAV